MSKKDDRARHHSDDHGHHHDKPNPPGATPDPSHEPLPKDFEKTAREEFAKLGTQEVTFEQFLAHEEAVFHHLRALKANPALRYVPEIGTITPCGNGDFEPALDLAEWQGAYGWRQAGVGYNGINFVTLTTGIAPGNNLINPPTNPPTTPPEWDIFDQNAHQTWVGTDTDQFLATQTAPAVKLSTTAPGSSGAVRIGNAINNFTYGVDLLSKTFIVTPTLSTITFWYAVVLQNPAGHDSILQPFFWVRVTDASGNPVQNAFDFGGGSGPVLMADATNPFFQKTSLGSPNGEPVVYKDWSCAQIDLSSQIGNRVTIEFVTGDCGWGAHAGYAYIDRFCGNCKGSPTGNLTWNCEASTLCGPGQICFDYELPRAGTQTGSVVITLDIYQSGALVTQLLSPQLTSGTTYCFAIDPATIPGLDPALGGFDFAATGSFAIGSTPLGSIKAGARPDGSISGANNDYRIACRGCAEIGAEQHHDLTARCRGKVNLLPRVSCHCPDAVPTPGDCRCRCVPLDLPKIEPCISVAWGDSTCDCMETDDVEVVCVTVHNCYSNVTFHDLTIGRIRLTDMAGNPVPTLPDGTPSVQVVPSGPICFGDVGPCGLRGSGVVSRELVLYTRGAVGKDYRLSFEGVCFSVSHDFQSEQCFVLTLCRD